MSRPIKQGLDYFPIWNPQRVTVSNFGNSDYIIRLNALRNSSGAFIMRKDVREIIFKRDGFKCCKCLSMIGLTIDHIVSVYMVANGRFPIEKLNAKDNLQTLCCSCNFQKRP